MISKKRIAFFGTPPFTTRFLEVLDAHGYRPSLVVTNPDKPSGRGMHLTAPLPKLWAQERGVPVLQPEKITPDVIEELKKEPWDLFIVVAYGAILPEEIITLPLYQTINVHYSLLPNYRGATPVESAILHGDSATGVCIQQMRYELDSGPIIAEKEIPIDPRDTTATLRDKLNDEALFLLPKTLDAIFNGTIIAKEQDSTKVTVCKKIKKESGHINLGDDPSMNDRIIRAYTPSPGTFFMIEKKGKEIRVKIKSAHLADGTLILDHVVPENGKPMTGEQFALWQQS